MYITQGNQALAWLFVALAVGANIAGYALNLYRQFIWFDEVLHAYTIFSLTLLLGVYASGVVLIGARSHSVIFVLVVASLGLALGGLWEVAEWVFDQIVRGNVILGKTDTIIDLVVDTVGAVLAGVVNMRMAKQ